VAPVADAEADAYFATRPRDAQIGAWASRQSEPIADRTSLERAVDEMQERFAGAVVRRPPFWSGYLLTPDEVEFWQGREHRLHDRFRYTRTDTGWLIERLSP
jgi:pyridoxamine 5'-phosphate oxidase